MLPNEIAFLKLLWDPADIAGDQVKPSAFRKQELSGQPGDFVSVDRRDIAKRSVMEDLAASQKEKAVGRTDLGREAAFIGILNSNDLRSCCFDETKTMPIFEVRPHPLDKNLAHCGIHNVSGQTGRSKMDKMRGLLATMAAPIRTFDDVFD